MMLKKMAIYYISLAITNDISARKGNQSINHDEYSLKQVLLFGVGLVVALGLYHFINTKNTNLSSYWPQHNTNNNNTNQPEPISAVNVKPGFDYFVFVLQWPAAFCNIQRNKQRKCNPDHPLPKHQDKFTIHGLWPQLNGGVSPLSCSGSTMQNNDLVAFLLEYRPNMFSAQDFKSSMGFWIWEWNKHGKSSNKFNPRRYLQITIDPAKKYAKSIYDELQKRGIKPDGTTPRRMEDIREVVMKVTGCYYPMINTQLHDSGEHLLLEIQLCPKRWGYTL